MKKSIFRFLNPMNWYAPKNQSTPLSEWELFHFKTEFRNFFEPVYDVEQCGEEYIPIVKFDITDFTGFVLPDGSVKLEITLGRPGLLIGKAGRTIDALRAYLNKPEGRVKIEVELKESMLWHCPKGEYQQCNF